MHINRQYFITVWVNGYMIPLHTVCPSFRKSRLNKSTMGNHLTLTFQNNSLPSTNKPHTPHLNLKFLIPLPETSVPARDDQDTWSVHGIHLFFGGIEVRSYDTEFLDRGIV